MRFLKKPNVAEASEHFSKLAHNLTDGDALPQAGLCCIAIARCEQSLSNSVAEIAAMLEAARNFIKAELLNNNLLCPSYNEHLIVAVSCYEVAIKLYKEQDKFALAGSIAFELSKMLTSLGKHSQAVIYMEEASTYFIDSPYDYMNSLSELSACKIDLGDLEGALRVYAKILSLSSIYNTSIFTNLMINTELCCLFLLLILQPVQQQMKAEQSQLLKKYAGPSSEIQNGTYPLNDPEMDVILNSLVLACHCNDYKQVNDLGPYLSPKLSGQSLHLFSILLKERGEAK